MRSDYVIEILMETGFAGSKAEARRLIVQGGGEAGGKRIKETTARLDRIDGTILRVGKRKIAKLIFG